MELNDEEIQIFSIRSLPKLSAVRVLQIRFLSDRFICDLMVWGYLLCLSYNCLGSRVAKWGSHIFTFTILSIFGQWWGIWLVFLIAALGDEMKSAGKGPDEYVLYLTYFELTSFFPFLHNRLHTYSPQCIEIGKSSLSELTSISNLYFKARWGFSVLFHSTKGGSALNKMSIRILHLPIWWLKA